MVKIALIDNYDSFTYNLVQRISEAYPQAELEVLRNDQVTLAQLDQWQPTHLIVSPGPCAPAQAGISKCAIRHFAGRIPVLGVCLGHQCIGEEFGATIVRADRIMHGKTSQIHHDGKKVYADLPSPFPAMRYHSLVIAPMTVPEGWLVTSKTDRDEIMGIRHREWPVEGVQFHPESFLTEVGQRLLRNFVEQS